MSNSGRGLIGVRCGYLLLGYRLVSVAVLIPDVTPLTSGEAVHHVLGRSRGVCPDPLGRCSASCWTHPSCPQPPRPSRQGGPRRRGRAQHSQPLGVGACLPRSRGWVGWPSGGRRLAGATDAPPPRAARAATAEAELTVHPLLGRSPLCGRYAAPVSGGWWLGCGGVAADVVTPWRRSSPHQRLTLEPAPVGYSGLPPLQSASLRLLIFMRAPRSTRRTGREEGSPTWRSSMNGWPRSTSERRSSRWRCAPPASSLGSADSRSASTTPSTRRWPRW